MRILNAGKSKYYDEALANIEAARKCYLAAGLDELWRKTSTEIRRDHYRKYGFMPGFEEIVAGKKRSRNHPSSTVRVPNGRAKEDSSGFSDTAIRITSIH